MKVLKKSLELEVSEITKFYKTTPSLKKQPMGSKPPGRDCIDNSVRDAPHGRGHERAELVPMYRFGAVGLL